MCYRIFGVCGCVFVLQSCQETNVFQAGSITCLRVIHGALLSSLVPLYLSNSTLFGICYYCHGFLASKAAMSQDIEQQTTASMWLCVGVHRLRLALAIIPDKPYKKSGFIIAPFVCTPLLISDVHIGCDCFNILKHLWFIDPFALC